MLLSSHSIPTACITPVGKVFTYQAALAMTAQHKIIEKIADNGSCIIVGRAADYVLKDRDNVVRIFIHAPEEYRIGRVMEVYGDSREEAKDNICRSDKARAAYYHHISSNRWGDEKNYDLVLDSSCGVQESCKRICEFIEEATAEIH